MLNTIYRIGQQFANHKKLKNTPPNSTKKNDTHEKPLSRVCLFILQFPHIQFAQCQLQIAAELEVLGVGRKVVVGLEKSFLVPANTFDNVSGSFSISFQVWNLQEMDCFNNSVIDLYDKNGVFVGNKKIFAYENFKYLNDWTLDFIEKDKVYERQNSIGNIIGVSNDFQNQNSVCIENPNKLWNHKYQWQITKNNLIESCIYFAVRKCIEHSWINHYDQFLYPNNGWKIDFEFQTNCLVWTLFNGKNIINSKGKINH